MFLALLVADAHAAGFHYIKTSAIGATDTAGEVQAGLGVSFVSDALSAWATAGDPRTGPLVRTWRLEGQPLGPVIGYVPPAFRGVVAPVRVPWAVPWTSFRVGGDDLARKDLEVDLATHRVLNVPGAFGVDPRHAYVGPSLGLGLNGTWWDGWRGGDTPVMTGKVTAQGGFGAGVTLRDAWYAQGRVVARLDLFGEHQTSVGAAATTGVSLERLGVPVGVELRGQVERGDDTWTAAPTTSWTGSTSVSWKLAPPFQTRIEERVEQAQREQARRSDAESPTE